MRLLQAISQDISILLTLTTWQRDGNRADTLRSRRRRQVSKTLRGLSSTNIIESVFIKAAKSIRNVKNWKNGTMVRRWVCVALLDAESRTAA